MVVPLAPCCRRGASTLISHYRAEKQEPRTKNQESGEEQRLSATERGRSARTSPTLRSCDPHHSVPAQTGKEDRMFSLRKLGGQKRLALVMVLAMFLFGLGRSE